MNKKIMTAFNSESCICRLLAAWCSFSFYLLLYGKGNFFQLEYAQNTSFVRSVLIIFLFFAVYSCIRIFINKEESDSWFLIVSATLCVIRWLDRGDGIKNKFLFLMAVVAVYGFFVMYFIKKNALMFEKIRFGKKTEWCLVLFCGLFGGTVIAAITSLRYLTFSSSNFDFGIFVNMFHNMRETGLPGVSCERDVFMSHFAVHISPVYYLLLPFYALIPSTLTLQIGQAVIVSSGVIPVFCLCRVYKLSEKSTVAAAFLYALHPALSTGCFYDIHENCFLAPLLLWIFYFFERKRMISMYIFAFLTLSVKEDAAIFILIFAVYLLFSKRSVRHGVFLSVIAAIYFSIALAILQKMSGYYAVLYADQTPNPAIGGPMVNRFQNLILEKEGSIFGVLKTAFFNPGYLLTQLFQTNGNNFEKLTYFIQMLLPLGFLPFFTVKTSGWLLLSPILINLLTNYSYQYNIGYQYHFGILAFFIYASVMNLSELRISLKRNILGFAIAACVCFYVVYIPSNLVYYQRAWNQKKETYMQMDEILNTLPRDASVACPGYILPHIADRREIYELHYHGNEGDVDYVVLDGRSSIDQKQLEIFLQQGYVVWQEHDGLLTILKKADASSMFCRGR